MDLAPKAKEVGLFLPAKVKSRGRRATLLVSCYLRLAEMAQDFHIRRMTAADLPAAMALKDAAGWNQTEQDWRLLLELEPDGCFVLESEGRVVASATAYCYGRDLAWIGMVLTLPEFRGRGLGSRLFRASVEFCEERGIRCIKLDATDMGRPLYERAGFVGEYEVERWGGITPSLPAPGVGNSCAALTEVRLRALLARDGAAFGASRAQLLCALLRGADWAGCLERSGTPVGYALARPGTRARYLGPCLAEDAAGARPLLEAFFAGHAGRPVFVDVPAPNAEARSLLRGFGLEARRTLLRMYRGPNDSPGEPSRIFGLAGFEYG
ncbi:MAG: GNAT family N-acetyltransferase [Candidatus Limnocylindria bacterium]